MSLLLLQRSTERNAYCTRFRPGHRKLGLTGFIVLSDAVERSVIAAVDGPDDDADDDDDKERHYDDGRDLFGNLHAAYCKRSHTDRIVWRNR
jgi:hypothetical protein